MAELAFRSDRRGSSGKFFKVLKFVWLEGTYNQNFYTNSALLKGQTLLISDLGFCTKHPIEILKV